VIVRTRLYRDPKAHRFILAPPTTASSIRTLPVTAGHSRNLHPPVPLEKAPSRSQARAAFGLNGVQNHQGKLLHPRSKRRKPPQSGGFQSGAERGRTADLLTASQALSQLSYGPRHRFCYGTMVLGAMSNPTAFRPTGRGQPALAERRRTVFLREPARGVFLAPLVRVSAPRRSISSA
jgi:hypothetical protein